MTGWAWDFDGDTIVAEERLLSDRKERIRDVRQGPDGYVYIVTDEPEGKVLRIGLAGSVQPGSAE